MSCYPVMTCSGYSCCHSDYRCIWLVTVSAEDQTRARAPDNEISRYRSPGLWWFALEGVNRWVIVCAYKHIYIYIYMCVCVCVSVCVGVFSYLSVCALFYCLSVRPSVCLLVCLSACLSVCLSLSACLSTATSALIHATVCLSAVR